MVKAFGLVLLLALAGCSGMATQRPSTASPCLTDGEHSWGCQIERYHRASA
ncbi:hypothetical protein [Ramlibacter henchirensis]|jgi:hypothetical protein|uniref:hypothetical protein n=1 Tax=Ramlibacter henchirensis TaxID=204072 RepID=UPI00142FD492|nr:hypothetical protein [Ramlibacter henchirensis]